MSVVPGLFEKASEPLVAAVMHGWEGNSVPAEAMPAIRRLISHINHLANTP